VGHRSLYLTLSGSLAERAGNIFLADCAILALNDFNYLIPDGSWICSMGGMDFIPENRGRSVSSLDQLCPSLHFTDLNLPLLGV
jgi:hypothetical protein